MTDADPPTGGPGADTGAPGRPVRVRFAPSPSGDLHVGNVRTALYNWAFAQRTGGAFVLRIEDTDRARVTDEYIHSAIATLRWLGLIWQEGPDAGGPYGPYRQSERLGVYTEWAHRFLAAGQAYHCYCTPEELAARRETERASGRPAGYDGHCRELTSEQVTAYQAQGRQPVVRFRMPAGSTTFTDLIRGEVTFDHKFVPDFVLARADGSPLYTLAAAVDDVLMRVTHILRGEDLLSSTPRQLAVYRAMGAAEADLPRFGHLPYVLGPDGQRLSKRNGVVSVTWYRHEGFLPEALCNYLALLGWSPGDDREEFSLAEMGAEFDLRRVNRNPAQFDVKKLEAINGDKIRALQPAGFAHRITPFLQAAGLVGDPAGEHETALIDAAAPLVQERISRLTDAVGMLRFLFVDERHFTIEEDAADRSLTPESVAALNAASGALKTVTSWAAEPIEHALRGALVDGLGLRPRAAFGPVRAAVTGRRVSPPLFESIELLGRERTLTRLGRALATIG